ncbi:hypothetical protein, partial [Treponema socranskii]|uniref:hypothetical protein n=1 Tax=Treponema socranskii TaxID=53419 RepID=UPI003D93F15A
GAETHCDYAYEFSYNNLERNRDGTFRYFADGERWYSGGALRASSGTSTGVSASGTGGVGYGFRWVDGRFTGGGQGSSTSSDSWTDE